jgi:hypothetical protein
VANDEPAPQGDTKKPFRYLLGAHPLRDSQGGDAGGLQKTCELFPTVDFIRSNWCGKQHNSVGHSDVAASSNSKAMKTYIMTTGLVVSYQNSFDVRVYNIQRPSKEACPQDYSNDYFSKILVQRRLNSVKKKDT